MGKESDACCWCWNPYHDKSEETYRKHILNNTALFLYNRWWVLILNLITFCITIPLHLIEIELTFNYILQQILYLLFHSQPCTINVGSHPGVDITIQSM